MTIVVAYLVGLVFALGLGIAEMTRPSVVRAFLDVTGVWDPRLAVVMAGALATHAVGVRIAGRRRTPVFADDFAVPAHRHVDGRLIGGAALFGVGWGISGYCPGPALVGASALREDAIVVAAGMMLGMLAFEHLSAVRDARRAATTAVAPGADG